MGVGEQDAASQGRNEGQEAGKETHICATVAIACAAAAASVAVAARAACMDIGIGLDFDLATIELVDDLLKFSGQFEQDAASFQQLSQNILDGLTHAFGIQAEEFTRIGGSDIDKVEVWRESG